MTNEAEAAMEAITEGCLFNLKKIWMFKKPKPTKQNINKNPKMLVAFYAKIMETESLDWLQLA